MLFREFKQTIFSSSMRNDYLKISFDSFPLSAAHMCYKIGSALVQVVACRLFGATPLSKPMLFYYLLDPNKEQSCEILIKIHTFSFKKMALKISSGKCRKFCLGTNVLQERFFQRDSKYLIHPVGQWDIPYSKIRYAFVNWVIIWTIIQSVSCGKCDNSYKRVDIHLWTGSSLVQVMSLFSVRCHATIIPLKQMSVKFKPKQKWITEMSPTFWRPFCSDVRVLGRSLIVDKRTAV